MGHEKVLELIISSHLLELQIHALFRIIITFTQILMMSHDPRIKSTVLFLIYLVFHIILKNRNNVDYMCIYVYVYVYICVCVCVYTYTQKYTQTVLLC